jgi:hypothetical protein
LSGENQKPIFNARAGHVYDVAEKALNDLRRRIRPGVVKRNIHLLIDIQKTTGVIFCQLSA